MTDRQLQIFSLIGKGLGTAEIAAKLALRKKTVEAHKENIKNKMHCDSSQLKQLAIEWNNR
jgi:DNA-binding NarL/FixJ family response regulator